MSAITDVLRSILPEKLIEIKPEILTSLQEIKIASDNTSNKQTVYNNGVLLIVNGGENDEAVKLLEQVTPAMLMPGDTVLEESSANTLQQISDTFYTPSVQKRIMAYETMVPAKDYHILEAAIFIQSLYDEGHYVGTYLRDISERYGQRGAMICHLYSAGYFDTLIAPLYKMLMEVDPPAVEDYNQGYELIVTESPLALFISRRDTAAVTLGKITKKIEVSSNVGINFLNIHGIGEENRKKIDKALQDTAVTSRLVGSPKYVLSKSMSTFTIYFTTEILEVK